MKVKLKKLRSSLPQATKILPQIHLTTCNNFKQFKADLSLQIEREHK
jgi:hypothetical protein